MLTAPGPGALRTPLASFLVGLAVAVLLAESSTPQAQIDDSFITYRYADNLVDGIGLVWNPGERVEAITNLLWALLVAGLGALGVAAPLAGHILGVGSGVALLVGTYALARASSPPQSAWIAALAPWVVLGSPALPYFATSGMETLGFLALGIGALAAQAHGRMGLATALLCLGIVTRPDAGVIAAAVLGVHVLEQGPLRPRSWAPVAGFVATVTALTVFRLAYYGSPVPNTFYAKVGGVPVELALGAAGTYLMEGPGLLLLPALMAVRTGGLRALAPLAAIGGTLLYVVSSGGTAITFSRFLSPLLPLLAALAARTAALAYARGERLAPLWLSCLVGSAAGYLGGPVAITAAVTIGAAGSLVAPTSRWARGQGGPVVLLLAVLAVGLVTPEWLRQKRIEGNRKFDRGLLEASKRRIVRMHRNGIPAGARVGAAAIGALGYYGDFRVLDLLGLADRVIARSSDTVQGAVLIGQGHLRSNVDYIFSQRPDALMIPAEAGPDVMVLTAVRALWEDPRLDQYYVWDRNLEGYRLRDKKPRR
jgi:hypothetical protein